MAGRSHALQRLAHLGQLGNLGPEFGRVLGRDPLHVRARPFVVLPEADQQLNALQRALSDLAPNLTA
jgi:hypothetical protein